MADTYEQDLGQKSSLTTSDFIRVVGSDNVSYKQSLLDVGAKGQIGQIGLLSDLNIDNFATNKTYGTWWLNCTDSTVTGTKPASSGQGLLICKQQSSSICRQVYVGISGTEFKVRYYSNGSWTAWSNTAIRTEVDALTTKVNSLEMRSVTWAYSCNAGEATNTNLKTIIDADLPSGYACLGVTGFTTNQIDIVPTSLRYVNSNYSCQLRNVGTTNRSNTLTVYYLAQKQ
jgi:hypothetical protein